MFRGGTKKKIAVFTLLVAVLLPPLFTLAASPESYLDTLRNSVSGVKVPDLSKVPAASSKYLAGILDTTKNLLGQVFRRIIPARTTPEVDGQAIREKNALSSIAVALNRSTTTVSINVPSTFEREVVMRGILRGTDIDLGSGSIVASNVLYGLVEGEGITVEGDRQRPTISQTFWARRGNII